MERPPKLTIEEQIEWMKSKGITFAICSEEEAAGFLRKSTYLFKLKAFGKAFPLNPVTGAYNGVDFAYLVELSTLDMHVRRLILHATLDIEHFLKVRLLNRLSSDPGENGYHIIEQYFAADPDAQNKIVKKSRNSMCKDLIEKMQRDGYALWNVVEVLSFGDFIRLYDIYDQNHGKTDQALLRCLFSVRCLRNAAAHNNCLLNSLRSPYSRKVRPNQQLTRFISQMPGIPARSRAKKMKNPVIHDFLALLYVYQQVVTSEKTRMHFGQELHSLFDHRMLKRRAYFETNESLTSAYHFVKAAVDSLYPDRRV